MNMGEDSNFPQIRICQNGKLGFVRIGPLVNAQPVTAISAGPCRMKSGPGISPQKLSLRFIIYPQNFACACSKARLRIVINDKLIVVKLSCQDIW